MSGDQERPQPPKLGRALDFMRSLWALDHALQSRSKAMAAALGVTGPQRMVVRLVGRFPDIAAGSLAELLMIHPSTLLAGSLPKRQVPCWRMVVSPAIPSRSSFSGSIALRISSPRSTR